MYKNANPVPNSVLVRESKGFAHLFLILIVALVAVVGIGNWAYKNGRINLNIFQKQKIYLPSQKLNMPSEDTNFWYPYINTKYGFSIKFPINLEPNFVEDSGYLWLTTFDEKKGYKNTVKSFSVSVNNNSLEEEIVIQKQEVGGHVLKKLINEEVTTFNGYQAVRLDYIPTNYENSQVPTSAVIINNGKFSYRLVASTDNLQQILSTFELIKPVSHIVGWETTDANNTGIRVSFPSEFTIDQKLSDLTVSNGKISIHFLPEFQGSACANASCDQSKIITLNIAGTDVKTEQIYPDHKKNYTFKIVIPYQKPITPNMFSLSIVAYYPEEDNLDLIDQILSTFRFDSGQ